MDVVAGDVTDVVEAGNVIGVIKPAYLNIKIKEKSHSV